MNALESSADSFGKWLRQRRRALDLTQDQLAEQAGCAQVTIRKLEAEELVPSKQLAEILALKLGISAHERDKFVAFARRGKPGALAPGPAEPNPWRDNLPHTLSSFIGREKELVQIQALIANARLITLTGTGGVGKTRLALCVAEQMRDHFLDGVWLAELAPLTDTAFIAPTLAAILGLRERAETPLEILKTHLREKNLLLVLDNCEHLIAACAEIAETLLRACPTLKILATSREALGIGGETSFRVPSLSVPEAQNTPSIESLSQYEAVRLFIERASTVQPAFAVTNQNANALAQICHRLDGIPLALELAATRTQVFSLEQIAARLDDRFRLLTGGSRTALPRQQTLRAAMDWSYDLLSQDERKFFMRLAVFAGDCSLESVEAICSGVEIDVGAVADLIAQLVKKSLVTAHETRGESRYQMRETIQAYAREKLRESGKEELWRDRHLDHFLEFAERAEHGLEIDQAVWLDRVENEHANLRAALEWAAEPGRAEKGLRITAALYGYWWTRGYWGEAYRRMIQFLNLPGTEHPTLARGKILRAAGTLANRFGRYEDARVYFVQAIQIFRELGSEARPYLEMALARFGYAVGFRDLAAGLAYAEQALRLSRESGNQNGLLSALDVLGLGSIANGKYDAARVYLQEYIAITKENRDRNSVANGIRHLAWSYLLEGDLRQAQTYCDQAAEFEQGIDSKMGTAWHLSLLGNIARLDGDWERADTLLRTSVDALQKLGDQSTASDAIRHLGRLELMRGQLDKARELFRRALEMQRQGKISYWFPWSLENFALLACAQNDPVRAARLFATAQTLRVTTSVRLPRVDAREYAPYLEKIRVQLGDTRFEAAWNTGQQMTLEQAIDDAIETTF